MARYRQKSEAIDAHQWKPEESPSKVPNWMWEHMVKHPELLDAATGVLTIRIPMWGDVIVKPGEWVIRDSHGRIYTHTAAWFENRYELAQ